MLFAVCCDGNCPSYISLSHVWFWELVLTKVLSLILKRSWAKWFTVIFFTLLWLWVIFWLCWWDLLCPKQNRVPRGPPGGYHNQHGGYRPSGPPQQWGPPSAPPPSYGGYSQATQYPGPQQYQGPPQAYGAYPQQPSSGYTSSGWDQRSPATAAQPLHQGSYDYYAQQGQQVIYFASNRAKFYLLGVRFHHYPTCFVGYVPCVLS